MKTILLLMLIAAAASACKPRQPGNTPTPEPEPTTAARPWLDEQTTPTTSERMATPDAPYAFSLKGKPPLPSFVDALTTDELKVHAGRRGVVAIEWKTDSEKGTFGYYLLRADTQDGPYTRINPNLPVAAGGDSSVARYYAYYDTNVTVGKTYFYNLEEIQLSGTIKKQLERGFGCRVRSLYVDAITSGAGKM